MAKGSHQTRSPQDAKTCCVCGGKLRVTVDPAIRFVSSHGFGWHVYSPDCDREGWAVYHEALSGTAGIL